MQKLRIKIQHSCSCSGQWDLPSNCPSLRSGTTRFDQRFLLKLNSWSVLLEQIGRRHHGQLWGDTLYVNRPLSVMM